MFLKGKKVVLCPISVDDISGPYLNWINSQETDVYTEHAQFPHIPQSLLEYYTTKAKSKNDVWLAIRTLDGNEHIGNIELSQINWTHKRAYFSILLGNLNYAGKGFAYEAASLLINHGFNKLNLHRLQLGVHEDNTAAKKLYEKLGFIHEGICREYFFRNGKHFNMIAMGLLASEFKYKIDGTL